MTFIASYSSVLGPAAATVAWAAGLIGVMAALFALYIRPVFLGPLARPGSFALVVYGGCVIGELVLIAAGSRFLAGAGHSELRPALIATVVGLHFTPFAWAFQERLFLYLGGTVTVIGATGLLAGALGVSHAPDAMAVVAGLVLITILTLYAQGHFARSSGE
jgi:hypothetical protein